MKKNRRPFEPPTNVVAHLASDFAEVPVVDKSNKCLLKLDDMWLKSWSPYMKTSEKSDAILLDRSVAESYLPIILFYRRIKGQIIPA